VWWSKGRVLHVNPVAGIDSVTFGQFVNADTFLIVIDRASRRIVYDTIDEHVPGVRWCTIMGITILKLR
jgi:hypothetical protein